jgi:cytochrome c biogenesis protein CcdA
MTLTWGAASALWLGIMTSISPCPLATNIAAISFIGRRVGKPSHILLSGSLYTLGRAITYVGIGSITVAGISSIPAVSQFLQNYMNKLLGPLLILVGMVLLELIHFNLPQMVDRRTMQRRGERTGIWGAAGLGILFALSFCPVSAALFFGGLIPLSIEHGSRLFFPSLYGVGTALPVAAFAGLIAVGTRSVGRIFDRLSRIEIWVRRLTGGIFILVGIYYSLTFIFGLT